MLLVFGVFIFSVAVQLFYYLFIFKKLVFYKVKELNNNKLPISVIICAKDEADNLKQFLPSIYKQNYPDFELVLIDDRSIDDTWEIMESFREKYPDKTKVVRVEFSDNPRFVANKKYALTLGIKATKNKHLLFTDADCKPVSNNWISNISASFNTEKKLILGYGKYTSKKNSLLNKLIRFETLQTAMQYLSYALNGNAYMGVGRNMAYTKDLFFDNNGFYTHLDILSGDDDLFVNEVSTSENTTICINKDAFTESPPKTTWKDWIHQKRRHISTANHYKLKHKVMLSLYYLSLIAFYITTLVLLLRLYQWKIVAILASIRFIIWFFVQYKIIKKLDEKKLILYLPFLEISLLIFQFYIFVLNLFNKPKLWKN